MILVSNRNNCILLNVQSRGQDLQKYRTNIKLTVFCSSVMTLKKTSQFTIPICNSILGRL